MGEGLQNLIHSVVYIQMCLRLPHRNHQSLTLCFGGKTVRGQFRGGSRQMPLRLPVGRVIFFGIVFQLRADSIFIGFQKGAQLHIAAGLPDGAHRCTHIKFHAALPGFKRQFFLRQRYPDGLWVHLLRH